MTIIGENAMVVFDDCAPWEKKLSIIPYEISLKNEMPIPLKQETEYVQVEMKEPLREECQYFIDCILEDKVPYTNGDEALKVLRVLEQATEAMEYSAYEDSKNQRDFQKFSNMKSA